MDPWEGPPTWTLIVVPILLGIAAFIIGYAVATLW